METCHHSKTTLFTLDFWIISSIICIMMISRMNAYSRVLVLSFNSNDACVKQACRRSCKAGIAGIRSQTVLTYATFSVASLFCTMNAFFRPLCVIDGSIIHIEARVLTRPILAFLSSLMNSGVFRIKNGGFELDSRSLLRLMPILSSLDGRSTILVFLDRCRAARSSERLP